MFGTNIALLYVLCFDVMFLKRHICTHPQALLVDIISKLSCAPLVADLMHSLQAVQQLHTGDRFFQIICEPLLSILDIPHCEIERACTDTANKWKSIAAKNKTVKRKRCVLTEICGELGGYRIIVMIYGILFVCSCGSVIITFS